MFAAVISGKFFVINLNSHNFMKKTILGLLTLFSIVAIIGVLFIFQSSLWGIASHPKKEDVSEVSAINEKTGGLAIARPFFLCGLFFFESRRTVGAAPCVDGYR